MYTNRDEVETMGLTYRRNTQRLRNVVTPHVDVGNTLHVPPCEHHQVEHISYNTEEADGRHDHSVGEVA
jgi:hypothetical protein